MPSGPSGLSIQLVALPVVVARRLEQELAQELGVQANQILRSKLVTWMPAPHGPHGPDGQLAVDHVLEV